MVAHRGGPHRVPPGAGCVPGQTLGRKHIFSGMTYIFSVLKCDFWRKSGILGGRRTVSRGQNLPKISKIELRVLETSHDEPVPNPFGAGCVPGQKLGRKHIFGGMTDIFSVLKCDIWRKSWILGGRRAVSRGQN